MGIISLPSMLSLIMNWDAPLAFSCREDKEYVIACEKWWKIGGDVKLEEVGYGGLLMEVEDRESEWGRRWTFSVGWSISSIFVCNHTTHLYLGDKILFT